MRFSIILPVRNGGEYIKECVASILAQTYADFNLLVLDNDSTDGTLPWLHTISDKRLQIYPSSFSLSIEENWKRIKDVPRNEFMTMIGHDDILLPGYLQEMSMLIKKHPNAGLYQSHFDYIDEKGKFVRDCQPMAEEQGADEFLSCQFQRKIDSTGTGYMIRSLVFDKLGGMPSHYPNLIFADFQLWVSAMLTAYKATSPKKCFSYRLHQSLSRTTNGTGYQEAFITYIEFLTGLRKEHPAIASAIDRHGKEFLLYYCESISHRLLKTPVEQRRSRVLDFIVECESLAADFIPQQSFKPLDVFRIRLAKELDQHSLTRKAFQLLKKFKK